MRTSHALKHCSPSRVLPPDARITLCSLFKPQYFLSFSVLQRTVSVWNSSFFFLLWISLLCARVAIVNMSFLHRIHVVFYCFGPRIPVITIQARNQHFKVSTEIFSCSPTNSDMRTALITVGWLMKIIQLFFFSDSKLSWVYLVFSNKFVQHHIQYIPDLEVGSPADIEHKCNLINRNHSLLKWFKRDFALSASRFLQWLDRLWYIELIGDFWGGKWAEKKSTRNKGRC